VVFSRYLRPVAEGFGRRSGKTTMIAAVAAAYQRAGWRAVGAAPTARAARQLRELAGVEATTMHSLLARVNRAGATDPATRLRKAPLRSARVHQTAVTRSTKSATIAIV
jgi:ATP-dependent exoDNAse (exonuclease V) alpha subunit